MYFRNARAGRRLTTLTALALLAGTAGCGSGRHPVHGRVTYEDGSPLTEGSVVGELADGETKVMARGNVQSDGSFSWGTERPGDGARPGKYRVVVIPRALGDAERAHGKLPAVDEKYSRFETSPVEFTVKDGPNELIIKVARPKGKGP